MKPFLLATAALSIAATPALASPKVAVDILPVQSLVAKVMEGVGMPTVIVPPGASPHGYAMRPSEAAALQDADVVFWVGEELSPQFGRSVGSLASDATVVSLLNVPNTVRLNFRQGATFEAHDHGHEEHAHDDHAHEEHAKATEAAHDDHDHDDHAHGEHAHDDHAHDEQAKATEAAHDDHDHDDHAHGEHAHDDHAHEEHAKATEAAHDDHDHDDHAHGEHAHDDHAHDEHAKATEAAHDDHDHDDHAHGEHDHDDHAHDDHAHETADAHHDHDHAHDGVDPHAWLDPENAKVWVDAIAATLSQADPDNASTYFTNAAAAKSELDALIAEVSTTVEPIQGREFVVFHDAYHYFEERFGLEAAGAISLGDAARPSPARVAEIRDAISDMNAACVFSEPQFEPRLVDTVIEGTNTSKGMLDPLGAALEPGTALYPTLIRNLADGLVECLRPQS